MQNRATIMVGEETGKDVGKNVFFYFYPTLTLP